MDSKEDAPIPQTTWKRLNQILDSKTNSARKFLDHLENIKGIKVTETEDGLEIEVPWLPSALSNSAISSAARKSIGDPRIDTDPNTDREPDLDLDQEQAQELDEIPF